MTVANKKKILISTKWLTIAKKTNTMTLTVEIGVKMMKFEKKKEILKEIFEKTDKMNDAEKNYLLGYIQGFNDKKYLSVINKAQ